MDSLAIRNKWTSYALAALRIIVGWHFLYEGLVKLLDPAWTAKPFLEGSRWIFGDLFRMLASGDVMMNIIDLANSVGLTLIGIALILGVFTKLASWCGIALLALYYVAYPPFGNYSYGAPSEGSYLFVNKNVVELFALLLLALTRPGEFFGLDILRVKKSSDKPAEAQATAEIPVSANTKRRELLKSLTGIPVLALFSGVLAKNIPETGPDALSGATIKVDYKQLKDLKGKLPQGKLGNLSVSRMIMGCNLIGGWAHARDLRYANVLFRAYNTERKIIETFHLGEQAGINTVFMVTQYYAAFNKYLKVYGGKMQSVCQAMLPDADFYSDINKAIDAGATALYIQGGEGDRYVRDGKADKLGEALEMIKKQGFMAGVGGHSIETIKTCEQEGFPADFYVKTFHHDKYWSANPVEHRTEFSVIGENVVDHNGYHDNIWDLYPSQTREYMNQIKKPWIAFKVMAAGAIEPREAFQYAFEGGADFICVGMFDFQVVEDVNIVNEVLANINLRHREWYS